MVRQRRTRSKVKRNEILSVIEGFSAVTREEYIIKKCIYNIGCIFPDIVEQSKEILAIYGADTVLPYLQAAIEKKEYETENFWNDVADLYVMLGVQSVPYLIPLIEMSFRRDQEIAEETDEMEDSEDLDLYDPDAENPYDIRYAATEALVGIGSPAVPFLCRALQSGNDKMKGTIIDILGDIRDASALPDLIAIFDDPNKDLHWRAREAIINLGPSVYDALLPNLYADNPYLICAVAYILPRIERERGIADLIPLFDSGSDYRWEGAYQSLSYLEPFPENEMIQQFSADNSEHIVGALCVLGSSSNEAIIPDIQKLLTHPGEDVPYFAQRAIDAIRSRAGRS